MSTSSTGANEIRGGKRTGQRLVAVVVALLSVFAVGVAAPAGAGQLDGGGAGGGGGGSWSLGDGAASFAPAKGDPSIWPKPNDVRTNLSAAQSQQMVEDCPLYNLC